MAKVGRPRKVGRKPTNGVRMKQASLSLTPGEKRRLGAYSKRLGLNFSTWARNVLIEAAMNKEG